MVRQYKEEFVEIVSRWVKGPNIKRGTQQALESKVPLAIESSLLVEAKPFFNVDSHREPDYRGKILTYFCRMNPNVFHVIGIIGQFYALRRFFMLIFSFSQTL